MVERSRFWDGTTLGDATVAPYDAATEFSEVMLALSGGYPDANKGGTLGLLSLACSVFAANTLRVAAGQAIVWGTWYENSANLDFTIPTPAASTRIDRIVVRKSWAAQTTRLTRIAGAEGGAAPAMVQTSGTTWDIPICNVSITTGGTMTITDARNQNSMWYRTATTTIRTDSFAGFGVTAKATWSSIYPGFQIGQTAALYASNVSDTFGITANTYFDGASQKALVSGAAIRLNLTIGAINFDTAPSVAADATQTFTTRMSLSNLGKLDTMPAVGTWSFQSTPSGGNARAILMGFVDGASNQHCYIGSYNNAGSADLVIMNGIGGGVGGNIILYPSGGTNVRPFVDGAYTFGTASFRWTTVYATVGAINTSRREYKHEFADVDPAHALEVVLATPILSYEYKALPERRFTGFIANDADPMLSPDQDSVDPGTTASVAIAAIQGLAAQVDFLVKRVNALEGN